MIKVVNERKYYIKHMNQLRVGSTVKHLATGNRYVVIEKKKSKVTLDDGKGSYKSKFVTSFEMLKHDYVLLKFIDKTAGWQPSIILNMKELQVRGPKDKQEFGMQYKYIINQFDNKIFRYECQHLNDYTDGFKPTGDSVITDTETGERLVIRDEIILQNFYLVDPIFKDII